MVEKIFQRVAAFVAIPPPGHLADCLVVPDFGLGAYIDASQDHLLIGNSRLDGLDPKLSPIQLVAPDNNLPLREFPMY